MTYEILEESVDDGEPVELYRFEYGENTYFYTTASVSVTHAGEVYIPEPMERTETDLSSDMNKALLKISTTKNNQVVQLFMPGALFANLFVTIFRQHGTGTDVDFVTVYKGRVTTCNIVKMEATLHCEPIFTSLRREGLRRTYEPSCPLMLYEQACKVDKSAFLVSGPVTVFDGRKQLTIPVAATKADGWFDGGVAVVNGQPKMVASHVGSLITLMSHMQGISIVGDVSLYPGCDHTRATCDTKFNNLLNYGGFPWMSARNPFEGDSVHWVHGG